MSVDYASRLHSCQSAAKERSGLMVEIITHRENMLPSPTDSRVTSGQCATVYHGHKVQFPLPADGR